MRAAHSQAEHPLNQSTERNLDMTYSDDSARAQYQERWLLFLGMALFTLGLLVGLLIPLMVNARMGLSAHLEGVMNGMFLIILGLLWPRLRVGQKVRSAAYYAVLYGAFANIVAVLLAAFTGAGAMMPIAGGREGAPAVEAVITVLLVSLAIAMLFTCAVTLLGLYRNITGNGARTEL